MALAVLMLLSTVLVTVELLARITLEVVEVVVVVKLDTTLVIVVAAVGEVTTTIDGGRLLMLDAVTVVAPATTQGMTLM